MWHHGLVWHSVFICEKGEKKSNRRTSWERCFCSRAGVVMVGFLSTYRVGVVMGHGGRQEVGGGGQEGVLEGGKRGCWREGAGLKIHLSLSLFSILLDLPPYLYHLLTNPLAFPVNTDLSGLHWHYYDSMLHVTSLLWYVCRPGLNFPKPAYRQVVLKIYLKLQSKYEHFEGTCCLSPFVFFFMLWHWKFDLAVSNGLASLSYRYWLLLSLLHHWGLSHSKRTPRSWVLSPPWSHR